MRCGLSSHRSPHELRPHDRARSYHDTALRSLHHSTCPTKARIVLDTCCLGEGGVTCSGRSCVCRQSSASSAPSCTCSTGTSSVEAGGPENPSMCVKAQRPKHILHHYTDGGEHRSDCPGCYIHYLETKLYMASVRPQEGRRRAATSTDEGWDALP